MQIHARANIQLNVGMRGLEYPKIAMNYGEIVIIVEEITRGNHRSRNFCLFSVLSTP